MACDGVDGGYSSALNRHTLFRCVLCRYDLDLSTKPYKALRYHTYAVRGAAFHNSYPLFASSSDDGTAHVFHGRVYADLMTNPLIVPVKILRGHKVSLFVHLVLHVPVQSAVLSLALYRSSLDVDWPGACDMACPAGRRGCESRNVGWECCVSFTTDLAGVERSL